MDLDRPNKFDVLKSDRDTRFNIKEETNVNKDAITTMSIGNIISKSPEIRTKMSLEMRS